MMAPKREHRAWAEMIRTAAAVCTVIITAILFADKMGWW